MTAANIRFNGTASPKETYKIGDTVTLTNADDTGVSTWAWSLLSKPTGSSAAISSPTGATATFTVDVEGSYLVKLVVNDTLPDEAQATGVARILTTHAGLKAQAKDETVEGDATEGWARSGRESLQALDKRVGLPADYRTVVFSGATITAPRVLSYTGNFVTLPNGDSVPEVQVGPSSFGFPGLVLWEGGTAVAGQALRVLVFGVSAWIDNAVIGAAPGDACWVQSNGVLTPSATTSGQDVLAAHCLAVDGSNGRFWFWSAQQYNNQTEPHVVSVDIAGSPGVSVPFAHADHSHKLTTYSSAPHTVSSASGAAGTSTLPPARGDHSHQVLTGAPVAVIPDASPSTGAGPELAMKNHQHGLATYSSTPAAIAASGSAGTSGAAPSRGDHTHAHGTQAGGTTHPAATTSVDGFMSAADKTKLDGLGASTIHNFVINGGFDFWQRGFGPIDEGTAGEGDYARDYLADRWFCYSSNHNGAGTVQGRFTKQDDSPGQSRRCIRIQKVETVSGEGEIGISQEIDRRFVEKLRGKKLSLRFRVKYNTGFSGYLTLGLTANSSAGGGTESEWVQTYTAPTGLLAQTITAPGAGLNVWQTYTFTTSVNVPATAVGLNLHIAFNFDVDGGGGSTDWVQFGDFTLIEGTTVPTDYAYSAGSYANELELCRYYYEKSYAVDTAPGTATFLGRQQNTSLVGASNSSGADMFVSYPVMFKMPKRVTPTLTAYNPNSGASGTWYTNLDGNVTTTFGNVSTEGAAPRNGGSTYTITDKIMYGHWTADAEI